MYWISKKVLHKNFSKIANIISMQSMIYGGILFRKLLHRLYLPNFELRKEKDVDFNPLQIFNKSK